MGYAFLTLAILSEVAATSALAASEGLTRPAPVAIMGIGYTIAFVCLAMTVKTIPIGVAYAVWSGAGILLISAIGAVWMDQKPDLAAIVGLGFIMIGIMIVQLFSRTATL